MQDTDFKLEIKLELLYKINKKTLRSEAPFCQLDYIRIYCRKAVLR